MNWDITIGHGRQMVGRVMRAFGRRYDRRQAVLDGEQMEYAGRLQARYGVLKHQVQWSSDPSHLRRQPIAIDVPRGRYEER